VGDALRLVQTTRFDLALIDLGLPDGRGVDVVTRLRDMQPEAPSVVVTIHDDDDHLFPALQAGALRLHPEGAAARAHRRAAAAHQPGRTAAVALASRGASSLTSRPRARPQAQKPAAAQRAASPTARPTCCCAWPRATRCPRSASSWAWSRHTIADYVQADLPQAQRELARGSGAGSPAHGPVRARLARAPGPGAGRRPCACRPHTCDR
jgi:CheY-like chemotaxis protein